MKKINNNNPQIGIFGSLKKVVTGTGLSRVFGLFRDISTTNLMGASVFHDIFVICFKIPNTFRHFFAEGAFNQAFIPVYSDYHKNNDEKSAKEFLNAVAGTLLVILFTFSILVLLFAPIFLFMFAPGFYFDPQKKFLSVEILRIMFPYLALISLVAFAGGIQNTHNKFSIPAFTPVIFNICLIVAAVIIAPSFEMPIYVLAWGVLLSGVLQLLIQIAPLLIINRLPIPKLNFKNQGDLMTIDEIYAIGPAISVLMSGYVEDDKLISLRGTLVPATTINKTISSIPVLGKILVGDKTGEGVFGVSFKIKGPPKKLKSTVNPIKTLTPRFITRTLEQISN